MNIHSELALYKTKDQFLATLLYAKGQTLEATEWSLGVCYFLFNDREKCEKIISDYYKGKIKVEARTIFDSLKTIKGIISSR